MTEAKKSVSSLKYSIIIPAFNEAENLKVLHNRLTDVMKSLNEPYEIIFIDDGSKDNSFQVLKDLHHQDTNTKVIKFTRNFGQHPAIMAGFSQAKGKIIITLDADLQNPPEEIPALVAKLDEGYEVVFGIFKQRKHSAFRQFGSSFTKALLSRILSVEATQLSAFRVMRSDVVERVKTLNEKSKFLDGLICWTGYKITSLEVEHQPRMTGKTKYNIFKLIDMWFDMIVSLTDFPLKIVTYGGILLGTLGLLLALFYFIGYFAFGYSVPGFASTIILITIFAGIQLFCLGIIGEYIGRMSKEVKRRPEYIIREKLGIND
jgi:glycosyltransferase involved in cell wall biosynthesis